MSSAAARKRATYDDLLQVPDTKVAELIDGVLYTFPRPASPHARTTTALTHLVGGPFDQDPNGPGGWWILSEPELHFGEDVLVPDLAGWRRPRMPRLEDVPFFSLAPDWICEVLSPSTERVDRRRKLGVYAREKISHAWLIEPRGKTMEVLRLDSDGKWKILAVHDGDDRPRVEPFEAIELPLASLWLPDAAK